VYFFWLAALAALSQYFSFNCSRLLTDEDRSRLQGIVLYRFKEAIDEAPTDAYAAAFCLGPRTFEPLLSPLLLICLLGYRTASIYTDADDFYVSHAAFTFGDIPSAVPRRKAAKLGSRLTESMHSRIRKQLLHMLRLELESAETILDHPLHRYDALKAKNEFDIQFNQYHHGLPPFRQFYRDREDVLEYWQSHRSSHLTFILSVSTCHHICDGIECLIAFSLQYLAEKLFSVLPNSMCDERAGSRLTQLYSKLRTRMDAKSMTEQMQFSQFSAMVYMRFLILCCLIFTHTLLIG
jgi:hypothetical protein